MYERIVLVTDDQILSDTLTGILQKADFTSIACIYESEISGNAERYASALFIIDNSSQNAPKILQQLDDLNQGPLKPYLILVDTDIPKNIEQFLSCNPIAFISKPVNPPLLIVSVKNALSQINGYLLLHESEEKYRTIVETSMEGILIIDNNFHFEYVNPAFSAMIGVPCDDLIGQDFRLFLSDESKELVINNYKKRQQHEAAPSQYEFFLKRPDGTERCVKIISTVIQNTKGKAQTVAILLDITEQIMARENLLKSEERYQRLVESANEAILVAQNSRIVFVNNRFADFTGYTKDEACGMNIMDFIHPDDSFLVAGYHEQRIKGEEIKARYSFRALTKDGDLRWAEISAVVIEWEGNPATLNFITDITEKKNAELELLNTNRHLQEIINFLPDPTFAVDIEGKLIIWNHAMEFLSGMNASEVIGKGDYLYAVPFYGTRQPILIDIILHPEIENELRKYNIINKCGDVITAEVCIQREDKPVEYFRASASPLYNFNGDMIGAIETVKKITDLKLMETDLKKSLNEKDILLKEVHHRVKNNMQIISSILNLQVKYITDENDLGLFVDCTSRIQSMALVHEHLYRSDNLACIIFPDYIKTLIHSLTLTYGVDTRRISISDQIDKVDLSIDLCIPCALLINEIISNSLKHAFPDNMNGNINIQFSAEQADMYTLTISDTGIGLPDNINPESGKTLGLQLIQALVLQLNAEFNKSSVEGTKYIIRIPRENKFK